MGAEKSFLSMLDHNGNPSYDIDMVHAVSAHALNTQYISYLFNCQTKTTVYVLQTTDQFGNDTFFLLDENVEDTSIPSHFHMEQTLNKLHSNHTTLYEELNRLNLFQLSDGTRSEENKALELAMSEYCLVYAFYLNDGLPSPVKEYIQKHMGDKDIDFITFSSDTDALEIKQFFGEFTMLWMKRLKENHKTCGVLKVYQQVCGTEHPMEQLWYTRCTVGLSFQKVFNGEIKEKVVSDKIKKIAENSDPDCVFDISRWLLDLATLEIVGGSIIEQVGQPAAKLIHLLLVEYLQRMQEKVHTIFGYSLLVKREYAEQYLFPPKRMQLSIADNALNYSLKFTDYSHIATQYWNSNGGGSLLEPKNAADCVMVMNARVLTPMIESKFEPVISHLAISKYLYAACNNNKFDIKLSEDTSTNTQMSVSNSQTNGNGEWKFEYNYSQNAQVLKSPILSIPIASGKTEGKYQAKCRRTLGELEYQGKVYPSINFKISLNGWINFEFDKINNSGTYYDHEITYQIGIRINEDGYLQFIKKVTDTDCNESGVQLSSVCKFLNIDTYGHAIQRMKEQIENVSNYVKQFQIEDNKNAYVDWFLPAYGKCSYQNVKKSEFDDYYTYIDYVQ